MIVYGLYLDLPKFVDYRSQVVKHPTKKFPVLNIQLKTEIAIHHSLTRIGLSGSNARGYSSYHVNTLGWPGIGYSYVIEPDGTIKFCNPINWRTYHVGNSNNIAVGIVLTGDFRYDKPTPEQEESLRLLVARIKQDQKQIKRVRSHNEYPGYSWKACCVFKYEQILKGATSTPSAPKPVAGNKYTVQEGDTFWGIAKGKDFEVIDLEHANPGVDPKGLKIGQVITLPSAGNKATPEEKQSTKYHGNSISKYLESIGEDGSYDNRAKLAAKYGIKGYQGSAAQNLQLLGILRDGAKAPSTEVVKLNNSIAVGQSVTLPAGKLYAQGNAVNPVKNAKLTAKVDKIDNNWRNSVRLINSKGTYVGFARLTDLGGGSVPTTNNRSVDAVAREIAFEKHSWGDNPGRAQKLRKAGYKPDEVQKRINQLLK
ncbi:N-acetylmuramoyl-L-alanine amidase [Marinilactibacillus sp. XAAS-LB27]|uniref:N-acetylmuramoyl-L-alanine amidase n=1 Tax=Marinilactibacillus sp. XAAS-LB27 TaxID=3114538 RepID=UPI002E172E22|nr:N-acetylmuramoyl-L-alanine amidase [Marinilactibacillus sp. XAAS-LB27]